MNPHDIDPSLHPAPPEPARIGDGFAPPALDADARVEAAAGEAVALTAAEDLTGMGLDGPQSAF